MFLVKKEELRNFDVFFFYIYFCVFFGVWKREKRVEKLGKEKNLEKKKEVIPPRSKGCLGLFIALTRISRRQPFKGRSPQTSFDRVDLDMSRKVLTSYF